MLFRSSVHSHLGAGVTTDRRQFILFYLFYFPPFFLFLFAYLRFGSHFRSHDSHVTGSPDQNAEMEIKYKKKGKNKTTRIK